jgi:hypothetical protein
MKRLTALLCALSLVAGIGMAVASDQCCPSSKDTKKEVKKCCVDAKKAGKTCEKCTKK